MGRCRGSWFAMAAIAVFAGCEPGHDWTPEQIGNAEHLFLALDADRRATEIDNLEAPGVQAGMQNEAVLEHRRRALRQARSVRDDVLAKAHPDLPLHFRGEFQRSMELFLEAASEDAVAPQNEAIRLRRRFGDWWVRHQTEIDVPRL